MIKTTILQEPCKGSIKTVVQFYELNKLKAKAVFYTFNLGGFEKYPSVTLDESDLFLAGEQFDAYLSKKKGVYSWLDSFEKYDPTFNAIIELKKIEPFVKRTLGYPFEILLLPYPSGVVENAEDAAEKLKQKYIKDLQAVEVHGTSLLKY